jgi:nucleoid-associated protein YgaU
MEDKKSPPTTPSRDSPAAADKTAKSDSGAPPGENRYTQWYEVQSGDTLWKIAKERYGDGNLYTEIFKANQDVLTDPDKIKVGQKLRIP